MGWITKTTSCDFEKIATRFLRERGLTAFWGMQETRRRISKVKDPQATNKTGTSPEAFEIMMEAVETLARSQRLPKEDLEDLKQDAVIIGLACMEKHDQSKGDLGVYIWTSIRDLPKRRKDAHFSISRRDNAAIKKCRYLFPDDLGTQRKYWIDVLGKEGAAFDNLHKTYQELPGQGSFEGFEFGNVMGDQEHQEQIEDTANISRIHETSHLWEQELNIRQRRIAALYLSPKDLSNRKIGQLVGCDHKTVATDIEKIISSIKRYGFGIGSL